MEEEEREGEGEEKEEAEHLVWPVEPAAFLPLVASDLALILVAVDFVDAAAAGVVGAVRSIAAA